MAGINIFTIRVQLLLVHAIVFYIRLLLILSTAIQEIDLKIILFSNLDRTFSNSLLRIVFFYQL